MKQPVKVVPKRMCLVCCMTQTSYNAAEVSSARVYHDWWVVGWTVVQRSEKPQLTKPTATTLVYSMNYTTVDPVVLQSRLFLKPKRQQLSPMWHGQNQNKMQQSSSSPFFKPNSCVNAGCTSACLLLLFADCSCCERCCCYCCCLLCFFSSLCNYCCYCYCYCHCGCYCCYHCCWLECRK